MIRIIIFSAMMFAWTWGNAAELVEQNNNCDAQIKAEQCINFYCVSPSPISESVDCEDICRQCAKESCQLYDEPSSQCRKISL